MTSENDAVKELRRRIKEVESDISDLKADNARIRRIIRAFGKTLEEAKIERDVLEYQAKHGKMVTE